MKTKRQHAGSAKNGLGQNARATGGPGILPEVMCCHSKRMESRLGPHSPAGFTLIEVVLSVGLLAFSIMVIMTALGTAGSYAANDARRTLAVELLHRSFRDLELAQTPGSGRSPTLGLEPITWGPTAANIRLWFDADGTLVETQGKAFFRCELIANRDDKGTLGHLHGRVVWPVRKSGDRADGQVELFTSMLLP